MTNAETGDPGRDMDQGIGLDHGPSRPGTDSRHSDPLIAALARYVEALHRRYPEGPDELRRVGLDARAKVSQMVTLPKDTAA